MTEKQGESLVSKLRNQILALSITALATGVGMNVLFINQITARLNSFEKAIDKLEKKVDFIIERKISANP